MDIRELYADDEEALRSAVAGILKHHHTAFISILSKDSDGYTATTLPAVQRRDVAPDGTVSFNDHPVVPDQVLHFIGGGGVTLTTALKSGDEVLSIVASRPYGWWKQNGGTQQPDGTRVQSMSDAVAFSGVRSDPRRLEQVSTTSSQLRSDDGHHTVDHDPNAGTTIKSVDPSTPVASADFSPFASATKFFSHSTLGVSGILGRAVDAGTEHHHGVDHDGAFMRAMNGLHQVLATPGSALLSAFGGAHTVTADSSGVQISSSQGVSISCPPGTLSLPKGGVSGSSIQTGGDLSGTIDKPQVINLSNVVGQDQELVRATSDAAAASAGVNVGELYVNVSVRPGVGLLAVRLA